MDAEPTPRFGEHLGSTRWTWIEAAICCNEVTSSARAIQETLSANLVKSNTNQSNQRVPIGVCLAHFARPMESGETFVYHHDTQKGVGEKYNYSRGFLWDQTKTKVDSSEYRIPCYDNYKTMFECCDRFNRNLHDRVWPHKRGGKNTPGEFGRQHDFALACILQNVYNAYHAVTGRDPASTTFRDMCCQLADDVFLHSLAHL